MELLEPFEVGDLLFQTAIELCVLDGDADVTGQRLQQLHIFAGKEVSIIGAPEADDRNGSGTAAFAVGDTAGKIVVEIKPSGALALGLGEPQHLLRIFQEDVAVGSRPVEIEEADIEGAQLRGLHVR